MCILALKPTGDAGAPHSSSRSVKTTMKTAPANRQGRLTRMVMQRVRDGLVSTARRLRGAVVLARPVPHFLAVISRSNSIRRGRSGRTARRRGA